MKRASLLALGLALSPVALAAHPHIFVQTEMRVEVDASGQMIGVEISWTYDELFSLLVFEDMKLDSDYDGRLTEAELGFLNGFDMNWVEGYQGDTYAMRDGKTLELGPAQPRGTSVTDGQITTTHFRALSGPAEGVTLEAYDPTFYTAYEITGTVEVTGGCRAKVTPADLEAAYAKLEELLYGVSQEEADAAFPEVGAQFADRVDITCAD